MIDADHNRAAEDLRLFLERIERLEEEKKGVADDIKDVYSEAKAVGYNGKIMREVIRLRRMNPEALQERNALLQIYGAELGLDLL